MSPGSPAAVEAGCTCPVLDNAHGEGIRGAFWINDDCPIHGDPEPTDLAQGEGQRPPLAGLAQDEPQALASDSPQKEMD